MPLVDVRDLSYRYADGTRALRHVTFAIDDGECVGLVGPNGAGKSTLLWHLNGLLPECSGHKAGQGSDRAKAEQGRAGQGSESGQRHSANDDAASDNVNASSNGCAVHVVGLPISDEHLPAIRRAVGLVFQDPDDQLFCPSVREDVAFGPLNMGLPQDEVRRRVTETLAAVGLSDVAARLPHHLSVGERKRVCLAGVLACQPRLLALDEPTANLDPRARRQLMTVLAELPCAKIIASHDLEMILEMCSRVILLDEGQVRADGSTTEILRDEPLLVAHGLELPHSLRNRA